MAQFTVDDRKMFPNEVASKFDKFWQWNLPCPVDPVADIYRNAYSDKEWVAMRYLMQQKPSALKLADSFNMFWTDDTSTRSSCPRVAFKFDEGMKLPEFNLQLDMLPNPLRGKTRDWITSVNYFRMLRKELMARVKGVMGNPTGEGEMWVNRRRADYDPCINTPNQLYRLWPEIHPLMFKHWKREVAVSSMKSSLPGQIGYRVRREPYSNAVVWATPEQFRCEDGGASEYELKSWRQINEILTMVSLATEVNPVKDYPAFYGPI